MHLDALRQYHFRNAHRDARHREERKLTANIKFEKFADVAQMNYAIVYLGGILFFSTLYWIVRGKKFYTGRLIEAEVHEGESLDRSSDDADEKQTKPPQEV